MAPSRNNCSFASFRSAKDKNHKERESCFPLLLERRSTQQRHFLLDHNDHWHLTSLNEFVQLLPDLFPSFSSIVPFLRNTDPAIVTTDLKQRDVKLLILHNIDNTSILFFVGKKFSYDKLQQIKLFQCLLFVFPFFPSLFRLSQWLNADDSNSSCGVPIRQLE